MVTLVAFPKRLRLAADLLIAGDCFSAFVDRQSY